MSYSITDVKEYVREEDVKFIRLAFCDVDGKLKNASVMPSELDRAFQCGVSFDGSAIKGFQKQEKSDLLLFPDPDTLTLLPWRPSHGKVIRLFCDVKTPDGKAYELDSRNVLKKAIEYARKEGVTCNFGSEFEFYLFKTDENGARTKEPSDSAGYMDVAPEDKGENVRREICLTIEEMGLYPECSHHEEGPGQNEIDFRYSDPLSSADHAVIFKNATEIIANKNGLWATFDPKPLAGKSGSGMHVNVSVQKDDGEDVFDSFVAGVLRRLKENTFFFNPVQESYKRLGEMKAPNRVCWANQNRSTAIRIPATSGQKRFELRSPDGTANPYLAYALVIYSGIEGVKDKLKLPPEFSGNAFFCDEAEKLPFDLKSAYEIVSASEFVKKHIPDKFLKNASGERNL